MQLKTIIKLIITFYFFIVGIELIKRSALILAKDLVNFLAAFTTPLKAFSLGWFSATIMQSGGTVSTTAATFVGLSVITMGAAVYIIMGSKIGTTITGLLVSLFSGAKKRRDFRHGFEIALTNGLYNLFYIIPLFVLEIFTGIFQKSGLFVGQKLEGVAFIKFIPDLVELIVGFLVNLFLQIPSKVIVLFLGLLILFLSVERLAKSILATGGDRSEIKRIINKYFKSKWSGFFIGLIITLVLMSTTITVSLLVPLTVARVINLKKAIPYIIGANIGTATDTILAAFIIGEAFAISAAFLSTLFSIVGAIIWLPNTNLLFRISKYTSKRIIHVSKRKAFLYLVIFMAIPLILMVI